jgi:hypothetical protein
LADVVGLLQLCLQPACCLSRQDRLDRPQQCRWGVCRRLPRLPVRAGQLVATLGKLLLFQLAGSFPPASVYSASKEPKLACFRRILHRFGPTCR